MAIGQKFKYPIGDLLMGAFLLTIGLTLAWLGDYRGRQIISITRKSYDAQEKALANHERLFIQNEQVLHQNAEIIGLLRNPFPSPSFPTEKLNGPGQNR